MRGGGDNKCLINKNAKRIGGEGELRGGEGELDSKSNCILDLTILKN